MADIYVRRRGRGRLWLIIILIFLAGLWLAYWYGANYVAGQVLTRAESGVRGVDLDCPDRQMGGFPFSIDVACSSTGLTLQGAGELQSGALAARAPLYLPGRIISDMQGPLKISLPVFGLGLELSWREGTSQVTVMPWGLKRAGAEFEQVALTLDAGGRRVPITSLAAVAGSAEIGASRDVSDSIDLAGSGRALSVVNAQGTALPQFDGDVLLTLVNFGSSINQDFGTHLRAWLASGGRMQLQRLRFATEQSTILVSGPLTLSPEGLLTGRLTVQVVGLNNLDRMIEAFRPGSGARVREVLPIVAILTKPVTTEDGPAQEMQLIIRDGMVNAGLFPIGRIPPLMP